MNYTTLNLGDAPVNVGYDYSPREPEQWNALTGEGHPGSPADVEICQVQINGVWIGLESFSERWIDWAEQTLLDAHARDPREGEEE